MSLKLKTISLPSRKVETMAADTVAIRSGIIDVIVKSSISTSRAKIRPAIGALKIPAMAAAAPQPIIKVVLRELSLKARPMLEPMAEPVNAMGASIPTEPPKPLVMAQAMTDE
ncbi:MAG: hypothetical protein BWY70_01797 [Bacteroidetes bacterium ADurb.Bin408]|nr:MAG: hypothetical protein BWY70_01797 [Bacteroidetes bacterium ADurb.Bin408]